MRPDAALKAMVAEWDKCVKAIELVRKEKPEMEFLKVYDYFGKEYGTIREFKEHKALL